MLTLSKREVNAGIYSRRITDVISPTSNIYIIIIHTLQIWFYNNLLILSPTLNPWKLPPPGFGPVPTPGSRPTTDDIVWPGPSNPPQAGLSPKPNSDKPPPDHGTTVDPWELPPPGFGPVPNPGSRPTTDDIVWPGPSNPPQAGLSPKPNSDKPPSAPGTIGTLQYSGN
ncbi:hypothetical protein CHS0354_018758 [Potamilus streckersoni]|uniref:Uncharacterized protein n=1 Tax=Potamilus streckersoni TaxID=2493646 RepID=A0AAE0W6H7_9BIVA|nr:hypothetical protein CHS0354_018758 [Potamilus streckersoni]